MCWRLCYSFLHELLDIKGVEGYDVDQITQGMARMDLDAQSDLNLAPTDEAKPLVITDFVSVTSQDAGDEIQLGQGAMLKWQAQPNLNSHPCPLLCG